jgi:uncharacterized protein with HEPN domain
MSKRLLSLYVRDIVESIEAIFDYTQEKVFEDFTQERMLYSAVIREFEIIGEAVAKLPEDLKSEHSHIVWQDIKDFRNLLVHEYFGVDHEIVWNVITNDLPHLYQVMKQIDKDLARR